MICFMCFKLILKLSGVYAISRKHPLSYINNICDYKVRQKLPHRQFLSKLEATEQDNIYSIYSMYRIYCICRISPIYHFFVLGLSEDSVECIDSMQGGLS